MQSKPKHICADQATRVNGFVKASCITGPAFAKHDNPFSALRHSSSDARHVVLMLLFAVMQAENPKQQYLLLRALNEVITSLTGDASLPDRQQDEVSLHHLLPAHMISLVGLAFAPINELSLACHCTPFLRVMSHHCAEHTPKPEDSM